MKKATVYKITKSYRNGCDDHYLLLFGDITEEILRRAAVSFAENESSGQNYGWEVSWDLDEPVTDEKIIQEVIDRETKIVKTSLERERKKLSELKEIVVAIEKGKKRLGII